MKKINWLRATRLFIWAAVCVATPFLVAIYAPNILFTQFDMQHQYYSDRPASLSGQGVFLVVLAFAASVIPGIVTLVHVCSPDWDFFEWLSRVCPVQEDEPKQDPQPKDWR